MTEEAAVTVPADELQTSDLRLAARAVYLATEEGPADDLSRRLRWGADTVDRLQAEVERLKNSNAQFDTLAKRKADRAEAAETEAANRGDDLLDIEAENAALRGALEGLLSALAMGPLEVAASYGPDAHPDEPVIDAAQKALAALAPDAGKRVMAVEAELRSLLNSLQMREAEYRKFHDMHGGSSIQTGTAWDRMRKCGDEARKALDGGSDAE